MKAVSRFAVMLLALALAAPLRADSRDDLAAFRRVDHFHLPNGLEVVLYEDHRAPFVAINIWYHTGYRDDPPGRAGMAHLFEHLMFEGSAHVAGGHKSWLFRVRAFAANATTSLDRTRYFETVPAANLEAALWLESDRMGFLLDGLDDRALERAREAVRHEREEKVDSRAYGAASERFLMLSYPAGHAYGRPPNGSDRELDAVTLDDVRSFHKTWYVPANATISLAGDFSTAQAKQLVRHYFETLPTRARPARPQVSVAPPSSETVIHEREQLGNLTLVWMSWHTPGFFAPGDAAGDAVADLLTGGPSSRLGRLLDQRDRLTYTTRARQASHYGTSEFNILMVLQPGVDPQRAIAGVDAELADLAEKGPTPDELAIALASRKLHLVRGLDGVAGLARIADVVQTYADGMGDPSGVLRDRSRYEAITVDDVSTFVRRYLDPHKRVVVIDDPVTPARPTDVPVLPEEPSDK